MVRNVVLFIPLYLYTENITASLSFDFRCSNLRVLHSVTNLIISASYLHPNIDFPAKSYILKNVPA